MTEKCPTPRPPKLLDQVRERLRVKHYSIRTEQVYVDWIKRFIRFHDKRHPRDMGASEIEAFLTYLAVKGRVSASTQNQAKSALLFLYREVLEQKLPWLDKVTQAKAPQRLPVVLTAGEAQAVLKRLSRETQGQACIIAFSISATRFANGYASLTRLRDDPAELFVAACSRIYAASNP